MILLAASNCPSDWGWKTGDICSLTPANEKSSHQKIPVKMGSWSLTIELGMQCSLTMFVEEEARHRRHRVRVAEGQEVVVLGETIDDHENHRFAV
jgi:hypothetical protein